MRACRWPMHLALLVGCVAFVLTSAPVFAETASALLREGDELPGAPGEFVGSISNPVVNHAGGFALTTNTSGSGTTLSNIWGNATGGPGTVILTETTYDNLKQTSFESFHGLSDDGTPAYSAISTNLITGETGLDGAWRGTKVLLNELDPVPSLPGQYSTFNSRASITADGVPKWVGGFRESPGGSTQNRALFSGTGTDVVLMGGDTVGGFPGEPIKTGSSNIDFDYRFSMLGTNYITPVLLDSGSTSNDGVVVVNGDAVMVGGGFMRETYPVPAAVGGLAGENWDNFDFMGVNELGLIFVTGDTDAPTSQDEFVLVGEEIVLREGDVLPTPDGDVTVAGSIEGGYLNEQGDWAVIWDVDDIDDTNLEALLFNGEILLMEGDAVDLDGDGVVEPNSILANFTGITTLAIGDRGTSGFVGIYFTADIDVNGTSTSSDDIEGLFRLDALAVSAIPLPLDIKPGGCPNPINPRSNGVLPVAVLGTLDYDVTMIDLATLYIERADGVGGSIPPNDGPPGPGPAYEDVGTPFDGELCDCHDWGGDGLLDLSLKFTIWDLVHELDLDLLGRSAILELVVGGALLDGTPFEARDCVVLVPVGPVFQLPETEDSPDVLTDDAPLLHDDVGGSTAPPGRVRPQSQMFGELSQARGLRARLNLVRQLSGQVDAETLPLLSRHLREVREEASRTGDSAAEREAVRLLRHLARSEE